MRLLEENHTYHSRENSCPREPSTHVSQTTRSSCRHYVTPILPLPFIQHFDQSNHSKLPHSSRSSTAHLVPPHLLRSLHNNHNKLPTSLYHSTLTNPYQASQSKLTMNNHGRNNNDEDIDDPMPWMNAMMPAWAQQFAETFFAMMNDITHLFPDEDMRPLILGVWICLLPPVQLLLPNTAQQYAIMTSTLLEIILAVAVLAAIHFWILPHRHHQL